MASNSSKRCEVLGHRIAYRESGTGPAVLLVHGISTYSFIWKDLVPLLAGEYRVVAIDLLGCGESDKPLTVSHALPQQVELIRALAVELQLGRFHFVGHDVGGGVGQLFAVRYPRMLRDLTLVNTVAHDFWPVQPIIAVRTPIIRQLAMASLDRGIFRLIIRRGLFHKDRLTPELMELFRRPMQTRGGRKAFLHFAASLDNRHLVEIEPDLRRLDLPVLIVHGKNDAYLSPAITDKLCRDIPGSRREEIATAGHYLQIDEPRWLADTIKSFYKRG